jgi:hypothetical protein
VACALLVARFLDPLDTRVIGWIDGREERRTLAPLRYQSPRLGGVVTIPAEFDFDGASTPRLPLTWLIAGGRATAAAAVHDYAYQRHGLVVDGAFRPLSRAAADAVFAEAMAADPHSGTSTVTRWLMWAAVRAGGWWAWRQHARRAEVLNPAWQEAGWPTPEGP